MLKESNVLQLPLISDEWMGDIHRHYVYYGSEVSYFLTGKQNKRPVTRIKHEMLVGKYVGLQWMGDIHSHYMTDLKCLIFSLVNRMKGLLPESNRRC